MLPQLPAGLPEHRSVMSLLGTVVRLATVITVVLVQLLRAIGALKLLAFTGNTDKHHGRDEQKERFHRAVS